MANQSHDTLINRTTEANRDPLTGAPGFHPVGTGVGAAAGGIAAGALAGSVAGPVGTLVGAAIGAVAGGLAGKGLAESIDPTAENTYWRDNYSAQPYVTPTDNYDDYGPAYRYGVNAYEGNRGRSFDEAETELEQGWDRAKDRSSLSWDKAKHATKAAFSRVSDTVERVTPGDSDRDGK